MSDFTTYLQSNREKITLVGYAGLLLLLVVPLSDLFDTAWQTTKADGGIAHITVELARHGLFDLFLGDSLQFVVATVFGFYLGLLALMTIDQKKRWQALLLWLGTVFGLIGLAVQGLVLPNLGVQHMPALVIGLAIGLFLGGGRRLLKLNDMGFLEFRRASQLLFWLLTVFVLVALLEAHIRYPGYRVPTENQLAFAEWTAVENVSLGLTGEGLLLHTVIAVLFIITIRQFVKYDAEAAFFILGPRASGKSLFLIGAYLEALDRVRQSSRNTPLKPSQDLMEMLEVLDRKETEWLVEATGRGQVNRLKFQYVYGSAFPINIYMSAIDYAGEYLSVIPDAVSGEMPDEQLDETIISLTEGIRAADILIFTVDVERFVNNEPLEIAEYFSILQSTDNKDTVLVATKADILAEDFTQEYGTDAHASLDEFTEYINSELRQNENIDSLVAETAGSQIHPVYYQTKVNENGNRVPVRDSTGTVVTVGYGRFLDKMGEKV